MRVHFHIGHHKTGTTSLQAFLSMNAPVLLRHGIHYPWVEAQGAAMAVARAGTGRASRWFGRLFRRPGWAGAVPPINVREAHNAMAFRLLHERKGWRIPAYHKDLPDYAQMLAGVRHQVRELKPEHLVFCSEVMSHFGFLLPNEIAPLREAAGPGDTTLWCTLRRPDEQAASWHGQMVRFGQAPPPLSIPEGAKAKGLHFDYRRVVEPWLQALPGCRVMLRPYDRTLAEGGSVEDFVKNSGIPFPRGLQPAPTMNVSSPPAVLALLREGNRVLPADQARDFSRSVTRLTRDMDLPSSRQVELFGAANRERLFDAFLPIHDWLSEMTGGQPFFQDLEEMLTCKPIPEADAVRVLLDLLKPHLEAFSDPVQREFLSARIAGGLDGVGDPGRSAGEGA